MKTGNEAVKIQSDLCEVACEQKSWFEDGQKFCLRNFSWLF